MGRCWGAGDQAEFCGVEASPNADDEDLSLTHILQEREREREGGGWGGSGFPCTMADQIDLMT